MEDRTFDAITKELARGRSRRALLKGLLGIGGAAITTTVFDATAGAARRGYSGPKPPGESEPGPPTCNPLTCYGCHECVNGVCTDNPVENCYHHGCMTAYCNPDGGCGYRFDCHAEDGCCGASETCNASGQCVCEPGTCCGIECPGCQECESGACVRKPENCYNHTDQCLASVCGADGGCSYPFDCRVRAGCCAAGQTCDTSNGQCVT